MTSSEKLCLQWNDFQENLNSAFRELRSDTDLSDVTLVSEDGGQVEAHKVVLASSSPFFANLLKRNKHPHPLIFMRGVKEEVLLAIVDFLYNGEANVFQENLDSFLAVAEDLRLKGLTSSAEGNTSQETHNVKATEKFKPPPTFHQEQSKRQIESQESFENSYKMSVATTNNQLVNVDLNQLDDQIKSMMEHTGNCIMVGKAKQKIIICKVCGKEDQLGNIMKHIESNHITGITHTCDICKKTCRSRNALYVHNSNKHRS